MTLPDQFDSMMRRMALDADRRRAEQAEVRKVLEQAVKAGEILPENVDYLERTVGPLLLAAIQHGRVLERAARGGGLGQLALVDRFTLLDIRPPHDKDSASAE